MKLFFTAIVVLLFVSGCGQKQKEIEIVPNLDAEYLSASEVDTPANGGKDFESLITKDLTDAVKSLNYTSPGTTIMFPVDMRLYIGKDGGIDKIKDLWEKNSGIYTPDSIKIYADREKLDKAVAFGLAGVKFTPAKKNGENVKYRTDLAVHIFENSDGTYRYSNFVYLNGESRFFVAVEQMPEPIGGIKAIQNKIHYPELAKRAGIEGKVYVLAFIEGSGNVERPRFLKGSAEAATRRR